MALDILVHEIEEVALLLASKWVLPGWVSIGCFVLAGDQIKLAIHVTNNADIAMVTTEALAEYTCCHGVEFNHCLMVVSMVVPGTWNLTLER